MIANMDIVDTNRLLPILFAYIRKIFIFINSSISPIISFENRRRNVLLFQNCQHNVSVFPASMF